MVRGIEIAAKGMIAIMEQNDILANNLANISATGFKQIKPVFKNFQDVMISQQTSGSIADSQNTPQGIISAGSVLDQAVIDFRQGSIKTTGNSLDLALNGKGFFVINTPEGLAYTRNGSFLIGKSGNLTTTDGYDVIGEAGGPIKLSANNGQIKDISITTDGSVEVNRQKIDRVQIVNFTDTSILQPIGSTMYKPVQDIKPEKAKDFELTQGALESSNVNIVETLVNSITGMRTYDSLHKILDVSHKTQGRTINQVGRIVK